MSLPLRVFISPSLTRIAFTTSHSSQQFTSQTFHCRTRLYNKRCVYRIQYSKRGADATKAVGLHGSVFVSRCDTYSFEWTEIKLPLCRRPTLHNVRFYLYLLALSRHVTYTCTCFNRPVSFHYLSYPMHLLFTLLPELHSQSMPHIVGT